MAMDPVTAFLQAFPQGLGLGAIVTLVIVSIIKGWLVPQWFYNEVKERAKEEGARADRAEGVADSLLEQNKLLIGKEDEAHAMVRSIRDRAEIRRELMEPPMGRAYPVGDTEVSAEGGGP